jgi:hypothetical protein
MRYNQNSPYETYRLYIKHDQDYYWWFAIIFLVYSIPVYDN